MEPTKSLPNMVTYDKHGIVEGKEPSQDEIAKWMKDSSESSYYAAREQLREKAYGGKPPNGCQSWGDYWKSL